MSIMITYHGYNNHMYNAQKTWVHIIHSKIQYLVDRWLIIKGSVRNSQVEEMHRAQCGERARSFHALSRAIILPATPRVHQSTSSRPSPFLGGWEWGEGWSWE